MNANRPASQGPTSLSSSVADSIASDAGADTYADMDDAVLAADQQSIVDTILDSGHGLHALSGVPGAGKSFLIRCMARRMTTSGRKVRLYATTGAAAVRLSANATTVHTGFSISARSRYMSAIDLTHDKFQLLAATDVFIIDEMSM